MKVVNPFTYKPMFAEPDTASQTVAGQAFTLEELLQRYARGMTLTEMVICCTTEMTILTLSILTRMMI